MKKLTILYLTILLITRLGFSAQDPLGSLFMTNPYLINPGLTGTFDYYQILTNSRMQWTGFTDAPMTNYISLYGPMVKQPMGLGGYIMSDIIGPESITSFNFTYAYHYGVMEDLKVSMGLKLGMVQHKFDNLTFEDPNEPIYKEGQVYQTLKPDASLGLYAWSSYYHAGVSVTNLFGNKLQFEEDTTAFVSRLKQHVYIHGGYNYFVNRELRLEPQLIFRTTAATAMQMEINVRAWYGRRQWNDNSLWGGFSFRTGEKNLTFVFGVFAQKKIEVGYAYDLPLNKEFGTYHNGSHELVIGFKFNDIREY